MDQNDLIAEILGARLAGPGLSGDGVWRIWEKRTFNLHRGVLVNPDRAAAEAVIRLREMVRREFRVRWWRGFAFGAVSSCPVEGMRQIWDPVCAEIDTRDRPAGCWQFCILIDDENRSVRAVHTWLFGYLAPSYLQLLNRFHAAGYAVEHRRKEKDGLFRFAAFAGFRPTEIPASFQLPGSGVP